MAKVVWTEEAELWLRRIYDYIAVDKPGAALGVVQGIYERAQFLEQFPELGQAYTSTSGRQARILLYGHYRIAYRQVSPDEVHILGVFHGRMDIRNYFG